MKALINNEDKGKKPSERKFNYTQRRRLSRQIAKFQNKKVGFEPLKDGDKVKLNCEKIRSRIIENTKSDDSDKVTEKDVSGEFLKFIENNQDKIFTVETNSESLCLSSDKERDFQPTKLFSLKESEVKWLFHPSDFIRVRVKEGDSK